MDFDPSIITEFEEIDFSPAVPFIIVFMVLILAIIVLTIIAKWRIYTKANEPGWAALIPFFTDYTYYKISWGDGWNFLYSYVSLPFVPTVVFILTCIKMARSFGKGDGFAVGLIFLPTIFLCILAFGKSEYSGPVRRLSETYA